MRPYLSSLFVVGCCFLASNSLSGCGSEGGQGIDAGTDASADAGTDAGTDAGIDAGTDAGDQGGDVGDRNGVPVSRPRVLVNVSSLPALKASYNSPGMADFKAIASAEAAAESNGTVADGLPDGAKMNAFFSKAFLYLVEDDVAQGQQAITMMLQYMTSLDANYADDGLFVSRGLNRSIMNSAVVYDWCYDLMTPTQRQTFVVEALRVASDTEYGWPISNLTFGSLTGHFSEEKHPTMLILGIAVYDEDPTIFREMADRLYNDFVPARDYFYEGGRHHQGSAYGVSRFSNEIASTLAIVGMGAPSPYSADQRLVPYFDIYNRMPDGFPMPAGDDFNRAQTPYAAPIATLYALAKIYQDPFLQDQAMLYDPRGEAGAWIFLLHDPGVPRRPVDELPLARYFGSPFGTMIARTGWDLAGGQSSPVAAVHMKVKEYHFGNHDHLDAGHFSFYYKGSLALDAGHYGGDMYGSDHHMNYTQRTIAHNSILVWDPDEIPMKSSRAGRELERDGGQLWAHGFKQEPFSLNKLLTEYKRTEILAFDIPSETLAPDYSYLKGDIAGAYAPPAPLVAKTALASRSFVFLDLKLPSHPAALVVYDVVTVTDPTFKKTWLLHSINEPTINAGETSIERTEGDYNGKLVNTTLLPDAASRTITALGGAGQEFLVNGTNYPPIPYPASPTVELGAWRIELSPNADSATDRFLNVMQVMDAQGGPDPIAVSMLSNADMDGVQISDRVVMFSKSADRLDTALSLTSDASDNPIKFLFTDLAAGTWHVTGPVTNGSLDCTVTLEAGTCSFTGAAGSYSLERVIR